MPKSDIVPGASYHLLEGKKLVLNSELGDEAVRVPEKDGIKLVITYADMIDLLATRIRSQRALSIIDELAASEEVNWRFLIKDLERDLRKALAVYKSARHRTILVSELHLEEFCRQKGISRDMVGSSRKLGDKKQSGKVDANFLWLAQLLIRSQADLVQLWQELSASSFTDDQDERQNSLVAQTVPETLKQIAAADTRLKKMRKSLSFPYNLFAA